MSDTASIPGRPVQEPLEGEPTTDPGAICRNCGHQLTHNHTHACHHRRQISFTCPECRYGTAVHVTRTEGVLADRHRRRILRGQSRLQQSLSTAVVASFIDHTVPPGIYTIERTGDHEIRVHLPETVTQTNKTQLASRLDIEHLSVDVVENQLQLVDSRFASPDDHTSWTGVPLLDTIKTQYKGPVSADE